MERTTSTDARTKKREGADGPHTPELERGGLAVLSVRLRIAVSKDERWMAIGIEDSRVQSRWCRKDRPGPYVPMHSDKCRIVSGRRVP